jgi:hypothetical protein
VASSHLGDCPRVTGNSELIRSASASVTRNALVVIEKAKGIKQERPWSLDNILYVISAIVIDFRL